MESEYSSFISNAVNSMSSDSAKKILQEISKGSNNDLESFGVIFKSLNNELSLTNLIKLLLFSLVLLIALNMVCGMLYGKSACKFLKYCASVCVSLAITVPTYEIIEQAVKYLSDMSTFLGVLTPTVGILTAAGGNIASAKTQGIFFSMLLSVTQLLLSKILPCIVTLFIGFSVIDTVWGARRLLPLSQFVRNTIFGVFAFLVTVFFIIVNIYSNASAGSDTVSAKAMKLLISKAIPIVGSTVSDSLKFVGANIVTVKNSVGITSVIFIFALFIPTLLLLWGCGVILNIFSLLCDYFGIGELKGSVAHLKYAVDFTLATCSVIVVTAFINIGCFMNTVPNIIS